MTVVYVVERVCASAADEGCPSVGAGEGATIVSAEVGYGGKLTGCAAGVDIHMLSVGVVGPGSFLDELASEVVKESSP